MLSANTHIIRRAICAGCMSQDRTLSAIKDLKKYAFFCYALKFDEKDWICWECRQMVVKLAGFRSQVAKAQRSLADLLCGRPCQIKSLSKLISVKLIDNPGQGQTSVEVEALDPLYYQLVEEAVQSDDDNNASIDDDEAAGDEAVIGDDGAIDEEAKGNSDASGGDLTTGDGAKGDGVEVSVEELVYEDAHSKNPFSKITTIRNSSFSNVAAVSAVHLTLDESEIPLPQAKPRIEKNTRSVIKVAQNNTTERGLRTEDTFVEIDNPFMVELMSHDEMIFWRVRKRNMEFFTSCSPLLRCEECVEPFDSQRLYTAHMKGHSKDYGETPCEICELKFQDEEELKIHKERHYKLLKCKHCEFQWDSYNGMRGHCHTTHGTPIDAWLCDHCSREYAELNKLARHRMCHLARRCPECGIALRSHVKKHMLRMHKDLPMLNCDKCGLECKGSSGLKAHMESCRTVADQTFCAECNLQFKSKYACRAHFMHTVKHAGERPPKFQCTHCGKGFLDSASLLNHVDSVHERTQKYPCEVCGRSFFTLLSRKKHHRRAHSGRPVKKNHVCSYCGKAFERISQLEQHTNKHTGDKPYRCQCGSSFSFSGALRQHIRLKHTVPHNPGQKTSVSVLTIKKDRVKKLVERRKETSVKIELI